MNYKETYMERKLKFEIKNNQNDQNQVVRSNEDEEEIIKKCEPKVDDWMKEEDLEVFNQSLKKLGLCERKGLDGQIMLYPIKSKERKLEKDEFQSMMKRLYKVKQVSNQYIHLNLQAQQEIQEKINKTKLISPKKSFGNTNQSRYSNKNLSSMLKSTNF